MKMIWYKGMILKKWDAGRVLKNAIGLNEDSSLSFEKFDKAMRNGVVVSCNRVVSVERLYHLTLYHLTSLPIYRGFPTSPSAVSATITILLNVSVSVFLFQIGKRLLR